MYKMENILYYFFHTNLTNYIDSINKCVCLPFIGRDEVAAGIFRAINCNVLFLDKSKVLHIERERVFLSFSLVVTHIK